jgi:tRNA (guanine37-N1)-methyltransferase
MPKESLCLKVAKINGEKTLALANKLNLSDKSLEILKSADSICIPLTRKPEENELELLKTQVPEFQLAAHVFAEKKRQEKPLAEVLEDQLPSHLLASLPRALDVVGDIAIIEIPQELEAQHGAQGVRVQLPS